MKAGLLDRLALDSERLSAIADSLHEVAALPGLFETLRGAEERFVVLCDDLSFEREDADYKALKSVLDGGIEGRPVNVLFYATSNRRHLMSRDMIENLRRYYANSFVGKHV